MSSNGAHDDSPQSRSGEVDRSVSSPMSENIRHPRRRLDGAAGRKANKNLYEITGLVGKPGLISLRRPSRSRYLTVSFVGPTVRRVLYSTHREDSHYREQSRRIVCGRVGPRQIVTYFTFFPKGPADPLPFHRTPSDR